MAKAIRIGIVGGGQLGKMLCLQAKKMGLFVTVLDPTPNCPAASVCDEQIVADFKDENAIRQLASKSNVLTYEIELANSKILSELEQTGLVVNPKPATLHLIQNKLRQKNFLLSHTLPLPTFKAIHSLEDLKNALSDFNFHAMLKISEDSYDGRGNVELTAETNLDELYSRLAEKELFVEEWIDFEKELSVIAARNENNEIAVYPVAENQHWESILDQTIVPARISDTVAQKAQSVARQVLEHLSGAGVFCVELFLTKQNEILINEIAPRVHNSGHYSIEACQTSQFEQHLRAILNWPLGSTQLVQNAVMVNILGKKTGVFELNGLSRVLQIPGTALHVYGKYESKPKRKMGHVTIVDSNLENALEKSHQVKQIISEAV